MRTLPLFVPRRRFLTAAALPLAAYAVPGAWAQMLAETAKQTEGPFYPDRLPLDTDNDLLVLNDSSSPADGEVTHFSGRVLSKSGQPLRGITVELWQADARGVYIHSRSGRGDQRDGNFQGYGRFLTGSDGRFYFRTIKPVAYVGRTPHIHVIAKKGDRRLLTTQCYVKGEPLNERDRLYLRAPEDRRHTLLAEWTRIDGDAPQWNASWDIVLGVTPEDVA